MTSHHDNSPDQLILPCAERKDVNVARTARILGVSLTSPHASSPDQRILPFAEREYVNVARTARILGVGLTTVYRLAETIDRGGRALLSLVAYRPQGRKRVLYSSIVRFCDNLRSHHGIEDRRPKLDHPMFRYRDSDLLPFPLSDTIYSTEALSALGYDSFRPLLCLIDEGRFDAYQIVRGSEWRISRLSFKKFLAATRDKELSTDRAIPTTLR